MAVGMSAFGDNAWGWRGVGGVMGSMTLVGVFLWAILLLHDYTLALTAALLTFFNNFLYVMSRVAMMDIFLVAFMIWGLVAFTAAIDLPDLRLNSRRALLCVCGTFLGFACACKWNGIDTLAIIAGGACILYCFGNKSRNPQMQRHAVALREIGLATICLALLVLPIVFYSLTYWPLCLSLRRPFNLHELISMNLFIWHFHRTVQGNPFIACAWYTWMFQVAPQRALSYLVGNWAVMWSGLLAIVICALRFGRSFPHTVLVSLYMANVLQWAVTPQRLLYYYYYFPAAMLLGVLVATALGDLPKQIWGIRLHIICIAAAICVFLFCFARMAHLEVPFECALGCWS